MFCVIHEDEAESPSAVHYTPHEMNLVTSSGDSGHIESDEEQEPGEDTLTTGGCLCPSLVHVRDACIRQSEA